MPVPVPSRIVAFTGADRSTENVSEAPSSRRSPFTKTDTVWVSGPPGVKISVPPTLLVSAIGQIDDVYRAITLEPQAAGDVVFLLGTTRDETGGSEYFRWRGRHDALEAEPVSMVLTGETEPAKFALTRPTFSGSKRRNLDWDAVRRLRFERHRNSLGQSLKNLVFAAGLLAASFFIFRHHRRHPARTPRGGLDLTPLLEDEDTGIDPES